MRNSLKSFAAFTLLVAGAASANAVTVELESSGIWNYATGVDFTQTESVIQSVSNTSGLPELDNLSVTSAGFSTTSPTAVAVYSNTAGTETLTLDWTVTNQVYSGQDDDIFSMDGTWVYAGGTGGYAGMSGLGTFAVTQVRNGHPSQFSGTVLAGDLQVVPEPASYAVFGLGALGLIRRRKRA